MEVYSKQYWSENPLKARDIFWKFDKDRIIQPRMLGLNPPNINEGHWAVVTNDISTFKSSITYKIGQKIRPIGDNDIYIIAQVGNRSINFINLTTGNRYTETSLPVWNITAITEEEMEFILGSEEIEVIE